MSATLGQRPWMSAVETVAVFDVLEAAGGADCARYVGGCVRNSLIGQPVNDIDIATRLTPDQVTAALKAAGLKAVPTGIEHGMNNFPISFPLLLYLHQNFFEHYE